MKTLELHYPIIQFLIIMDNFTKYTTEDTREYINEHNR